MVTVEIKNLSEFLNTLKVLKFLVNSSGGISTTGVIFSNFNGNLNLNVKALDGSQFVNISWNKKIVEVLKGTSEEKLGIYNLPEFLTTLEMFGGDQVTMSSEENKLRLKYKASEKTEVMYNLSDPALIAEGPSGPKTQIDYLLSFKIDKDFLKKILTISSSLGIGFLTFRVKDKKLSYQISSKDFQSHEVKEILGSADVVDFEVILNIEKLNILPSKAFTVYINKKVVEFKVDEKENYELLRYYIAPLATGE